MRYLEEEEVEGKGKKQEESNEKKNCLHEGDDCEEEEEEEDYEAEDCLDNLSFNCMLFRFVLCKLECFFFFEFLSVH